MMPIYFKNDLGFSTEKIGFILAFMSISALMSMLPSGISNDLFTSRRLAAIALIALLLSFLLLPRTKSFPVVLFIMIIIGISRELFRLSLETFIFKSSELQYMPATLGKYHSPRMFGLFLGMVIAAIILGRLDFSRFFIIIAILLIIPLILLSYLPDIPISKSTASEYKRELIRAPIIVFMLFSLIFTSHWGAEYVNYGIFLSNELGLSNTESSLYMSFEFLLISITVPLLGYNYHKLNIPAITILSIFLSGIGHIFMVNSNVSVSLIFRGIHGIGDGLLIIITYMIIAENFSKERIGGLNAAINVVMMFGMLLGSIVYGYIGEYYNSGTALIISGIVTLLSIPLFIIWSKMGRNKNLRS